MYQLNKGKIVPQYFKRIAVVSPEDAAGLGDFKADADLLSKHMICRFKYYTATFQGDKTNKTVSSAIRQASFDALTNKCDAIVVIRGGGAKTDLHYLNEFDIAKEICESNVPVFVGVGHERDKVFIDEIANKSFDTPSKVISYIASNNTEYAKKVNNTYENILVSSEKIIVNYRTLITNTIKEIDTSGYNLVLKRKGDVSLIFNRLNESSLMMRSDFKMSMKQTYSSLTYSALSLLNKTRSFTDMVSNNINNTEKTLVSDFKRDMSLLHSSIVSKSPLNALDNGYAIIKDINGGILTSIKEIDENGRIVVMMQDGTKEFYTGEKND